MAKELHVSQRVVSAVVNGKADKLRVGAATRERIVKHLSRRGYVQSRSALQVKNGSVANPLSILFCGRFLPNSHLIKALSLMTREIEKKYGFVEITGVSPEKIQDALREQVAKGVRKLIWMHVSSPEDEISNAEKLFPLLSRMEQVIIYNYSHCHYRWEKEYLDHGIQLVGFDRLSTYDHVAEIFSSQGHCKVALDEMMFDDSTTGLAGTHRIRPSFTKRGFEIYGICPRDVFDITPDVQAEVLAENLIYHHRENGVNCAFIRNDIMGPSVINILLHKKIRVPEDIAIIGFGDMPLAQYQPVPLTTFLHPVEQMCDKTLELINEKSSGTGETYIYKDKFISRRSHGK